MQRIVVYAARRHSYRKLGLCLGILAVGAALLAVHLAPWLGWGLVPLGGGYAMVVLRALGEDTERVVIDDAGIRDSSLPVGTIGWDEVRGASVQAIGSVPVVAAVDRAPPRDKPRQPPARQINPPNAWEADLPGLYLTLVGTEADPAAIVEAIRQRVRPSAGGVP
jgi:hypothetical protein